MCDHRIGMEGAATKQTKSARILSAVLLLICISLPAAAVEAPDPDTPAAVSSASGSQTKDRFPASGGWFLNRFSALHPGLLNRILQSDPAFPERILQGAFGRYGSSGEDPDGCWMITVEWEETVILWRVTGRDRARPADQWWKIGQWEEPLSLSSADPSGAVPEEIPPDSAASDSAAPDSMPDPAPDSTPDSAAPDSTPDNAALADSGRADLYAYRRDGDHTAVVEAPDESGRVLTSPDSATDSAPDPVSDSAPDSMPDPVSDPVPAPMPDPVPLREADQMAAREAAVQLERGWITQEEYDMLDFHLREQGDNARKRLLLYGDPSITHYETEEEAAPNMVTVQVPVWKLQNGEKVSGTMEVKIHRALAEDVVEIFTEIYQSPEQFPFCDMGGYNWGGTIPTNEHRNGSAIDLNVDANFCIRDGTLIAGTHWSPGEDPYSVTPDGSCRRIFAEHGWGWLSGTLDPSTGYHDYMHFSYRGR